MKFEDCVKTITPSLSDEAKRNQLVLYLEDQARKEAQELLEEDPNLPYDTLTAALNLCNKKLDRWVSFLAIPSILFHVSARSPFRLMNFEHPTSLSYLP